MRYKGLVVGGPLAGIMLNHYSNIYRHPKPEGTYEIDLRADGTPASFQPNAFFEYCFVSRYWIPYNRRHGVPSIEVALHQLEQAYIAQQSKEWNNAQSD